MKYEEFIKIVPEETKELINDVLPYISYYRERNLVFYKMGEEVENVYSKTFFLLLYALTKKDIYNSLLSTYGFNRSLYHIPKIEIKKKIDNNAAFSELLYVIPKFLDSVFYASLSPLDLVLNALDKYDSICEKYEFNHLFKNHNLPDVRRKIMEYNDNQKEQELKTLENKMYDNLSISVISYLETASKIYCSIINNSSYSQSNRYIVPLSMLIAIYYYQDIYLLEKEEISEQKIIINLLKEEHINLFYVEIFDIYKIDLSSYEQNINVINRYLIKYCDELKEKKNIKDITVADILEEVFDSEYIDSYFIKGILGQRNSINAFKHFKNRVEEKLEQVKTQYSMSIIDKYQKVFKDFNYIKYGHEYYLRQVEEENKIQQFLNNCSHSMKYYIRLVLNTDNIIRNYLAINESSIVKTNDDIVLLSLIIGIYQSNSFYWKFFKDKNISVEEILNSCDVDITKDDLKSALTISTIVISITFDRYEIFNNYYLKYFEQDNSEMKSSKCSDNIIFKRLFDKSINNSTLLEDLCNMLNISYEVLKKEFEYGKSYEELLTVDDCIKMLNETKPRILDMTDVESVMNFGNFLDMHTKYIHNELPKFVLSDTNDFSIATINSLIDDVYEEEQIELSNQGFFAKIFNPQPIVESKKVINYNKINELKSVIDDNISALNKELVGYFKIRKYIEAYRQNNNSHYEVIQDAISKLEETLKTLDPSKDSEYAKFLEVKSSLQVLKNKANRFQTTNQLMKLELLSIDQMIASHYMTVNVLEIIKDDLIPLIGAEQVIYQVKNTENMELELTQNVVTLFQSLLSKNIESTVSHLKELEHSMIPIDTLTRISTDVENYLQNLSGAGELTLNNTSTHRLEEVNIESIQLTDDSFQKQLTKTKKD